MKYYKYYNHNEILINVALEYTPQHDAAFIRIMDSKGTQRSLLRSQREILCEPDTKPFECIIPDVEEAYLTLDIYSLCVLQ